MTTDAPEMRQIQLAFVASGASEAALSTAFSNGLRLGNLVALCLGLDALLAKGSLPEQPLRQGVKLFGNWYN